MVPLIAAVALVSRAVTLSGAIAGIVTGAAIAFGAGWSGLAMLAVLLGVGTLASARSSRRRDAFQVFCNGGVAALAALAAGFGAAWGMAAMAGALAAALSDTVAGELGARWGGAPRALLLGPSLPKGADGGMSWTGTALGAVSALLVPAAGLACGATLDLWTIAAAGLAGNLLDSLVGLGLQPRLGKRGNDWTNLFASSAGAALAAAGQVACALGQT
ncbi:MAG: DUF92 domain-containing protein [Planctomycetota bacterium]